MNDIYKRNVGFECMICKAYAGVPDPCYVVQDICENCEEIDESEDD